MRLIFKTLNVLFLSNILLLSCVKKEINLDKLESDTIEPSFAMPLGQVTFNLGRLESHYVDDFFVYNSSTGLLEYIYPKRLFDIGLADLYKLPNPTTTFSLTMPAGAQTAFNSGGAGTTQSFNQSFNQTFPAPNGELIDTIVVKQGTLDINVSSTFTHSGSINVIIPSLTLNGTPLTATIPLNYTGTLVSTSTNINIANYVFDMTNGGVTNNNGTFNVTAQLTNSGTGVTGTESINFTANFTIDSIQLAKGYFGNFTNILSQDTLQIEFFQQAYGGTIHLEKPRIEVSVFNTAGISVASNFTSIFSSSVTAAVMTGTGLNLPPIMPANNPNDTALTYKKIDSSNSNIVSVIDLKPDELIYSATSETNPNGNTPAQSNFVTCESRVWCDSRLVLPLDGWGNGFNFMDSTDLDVENMISADSSQLENIKSATIRIVADNGMPVNAQVQIYFTDTNYNIIDSLFTVPNGENIITKAVVNFAGTPSNPNYGRVTSPVRKITDVVLTKAQLENLKTRGSKKAIYAAKVLTNDAPNKSVRFYPSYNLTLKVSAKVDLIGQL